jgi:cell division protein FtsX
MEKKMAMVPVMWVVWGVSLLLTIGVSLYAARLGRNEESQVFLADSSSHEQSEQEQIASRIGKIQPLKHAVLALAGLMTLLIVAYYVVDAFRQFGK